MREAGITTRRRAAYFLAQVLHESAGLRYFEEIASGSDYEGRRDLGNTQPGDGRRFKGRGPIQLTGRTNYRAAGAALGLPLERNPTLAAQHDVGWRIAAWYWRTRGLNALADRGDFLAVTRRINGGTNGLADRRRYLSRVSAHDCRPTVAFDRRWLTPSERRATRQIVRLRRQRRDVGRRSELKAWLRAQADALVALGDLNVHHRRARIEYLRAVAAGRA